MASIISGYEYDIFISYRQKDNKHDCWVTEFVDNLKGELESTFKEEISVYFDINPHDGLLETHDVDASLKEKLKCLIFIPIISRTYCDPKSFAWEHEFKAFVELASKDKFGLKVRLPNGNVANRVLPVHIHDLDISDIKLCESVLGGVLRGVEFIYREPGVDRPLTAKDNEEKNLNKTNYRNQINKVALGIRDIITALVHYEQKSEEISREIYKPESMPLKTRHTKMVVGSIIVLALILLGLFFIPKLFKSSDPVEKTIAVLPFRNLSNDTTPFYDGFMEDIRNNLQKVKTFTVRPSTSSYQYRDTKKSTAIIGKELKVNYLVGGSVEREGNNLKIRVELNNAKEDKQLWSNNYTGEMNQRFSLLSEIAKEIATELKAELTQEEIKKIEKRPNENPEANNYYFHGNYYYWKASISGNNNNAIELYKKAIRLDPGFALAYTGIAKCLLDQYWSYYDHTEDRLRNSKQAIDIAFGINPDLSDAHLALGIYYYYAYLNYPEAMKQFERVLKDQPKNTEPIFWLACVHRRAGNWEMAKSEFEKVIELNPGRSDIAFNAGLTFDLTRDYSKAEEFYNMAIMLQQDWVITYFDLSQMYLRWKGDSKKAREILRNAARNNKNSISDSLIIETNALIDIYEGKYEEALKDISFLKYDVIQSQFYFRPKYLYTATIYGLMNKPELEHVYYDSTRIFLEKKIIDFPDDQRLYSSLGIAYAGLGLDEEAIRAGEKAIKLLPVSKEAWEGVYLVEDLALVYVMVGKYDDAIRQIKYLLSIPGFLSTKILELDPRWAPLKNQPEFKKLIEKYTVN